jgi:hypothetical protein
MSQLLGLQQPACLSKASRNIVAIISAPSKRLAGFSTDFSAILPSALVASRRIFLSQESGLLVSIILAFFPDAHQDIESTLVEWETFPYLDNKSFSFSLL